MIKFDFIFKVKALTEKFSIFSINIFLLQNMLQVCWNPTRKLSQSCHRTTVINKEQIGQHNSIQRNTS